MFDDKNKVTLLHLSDLHIQEENKEQEKCRNNFLELAEKCAANWKVDYIVITGDVMHYSNNNDYAKATDFVEKLLDKLHLQKTDVFVVPGNHDKDIRDLSLKENEGIAERNERIKQEREKVKSILDKSKIEDKGILLNRFRAYCKFANQYNFEIKVPAFLEGQEEKPVGICVIEKRKLCFVLLNTEWSYLDPDDQTNMLVGNPIVKKIDDMLCKYKDYRVITLVHRSFGQFDWEEVYSEAEKKSSMDLIIDFSRLILSGHGHMKGAMAPDFIQNKTQLLEGGAFGALADEGKHSYCEQANLLNLDFTKEILNVKNIFYDYRDNRTWKEGEGKKYWLKSFLYPVRKEKNASQDKEVKQYPVIKLIKNTEEEIEKAILKRIYGQTRIPEEVNVVITSLMNRNPDLDANKLNHVIFYDFLSREKTKEKIVQSFLSRRVFAIKHREYDVCILVILE